MYEIQLPVAVALPRLAEEKLCNTSGTKYGDAVTAPICDHRVEVRPSRGPAIVGLLADEAKTVVARINLIEDGFSFVPFGK